MKTFSESLHEWQAEFALGRAPATVAFHAEICTIIRNHWQETGTDIAQISSRQVLDFGALVTHYCPSRWNQIVSVLRRITPHAHALKRRRIALRQFTPPTQSEFAELLRQCDKYTRTHAGLVVRFYTFTGLRFTEGRAVQWRHVAADGITVNERTAKGNRARFVPMIAGLSDTLARLALIRKGDFVLPRANSKKAIRSACERAGIFPISHHGFRHLYATRCIESGVDIPTVARWLGHRDGGALLAKTYFHLADEHTLSMAARVRIAA